MIQSIQTPLPLLIWGLQGEEREANANSKHNRKHSVRPAGVHLGTIANYDATISGRRYQAK